MPRKDEDIEFQAQVAAWLFDKMHFKQEQIAEHLGIRQPDVSRRLKLAEERGWLSRPVFLRGKDISDQRLGEIENAFYQKLPELRCCIERLSRKKRPVDLPPRVHVFYSGPTATDKAGYQKRQQLFGWNAALYVRELVPQMHRVGVAWGKTIARLIDGLGPALPRFQRGTLFFPVSGEPLREHGEENSATTLAASLQAFVDGSPHEGPGLNGPGLNMVIPCIPDLFSDDVTSQIKHSLLGQVEGYRRIFLGNAGQDRLIDEMDTLITGVGTASKTSTDPWLIERVNAMHNEPPLTREDFETYTFGDIAGVYLLRPKLAELIAGRNAKTLGGAGKAVRERNATVEAKVKRINSQWTGIQREHVVRCAERARSATETAGVIVLAIGRAKSETVIEAVNQSLVNHLLIDQDLADALVEDLR
jgi:DNA-binding transcriptional regulator LsrR (DeoR family)